MKKSITSGQEKQWLRSLEDMAKRGGELALKKAGLDKEGFQRLLGRGDEMKTAMAELIVAKSWELSVIDKFADEEVESNYEYPNDYARKDIVLQTNILRQHFQGIGFADQDLFKKIQNGKLALPKGAEGWFAIPRWEEFAPTYGGALGLVLAELSSTRKLYNFYEAQLGLNWLRQTARTAHAMDILGGEQKGDILIVGAQFGLWHRGHSVRRARELFMSNEFGLGAFAVGCMLLTHPERLVQQKQLHVDCAGDEYDSDADEQFSDAPFFDRYGGESRFNADGCGNANAKFGAVSGFLPPSSV